MPIDTDRLDWLEKQPGVALVNGDDGRWAVTEDVVQDDEDNPDHVSVLTEPDQWHGTVRDAIDAAMKLDPSDLVEQEDEADE